MDTTATRAVRFSKPKNIWQWLMLFTPAIFCLVGEIIFRVVTNNAPHEGGPLALGQLTASIGAVLCLGFGFWLARESAGGGWKILGTVLFGLALGAVNLAFGFPGCLLVASR